MRCIPAGRQPRGAAKGRPFSPRREGQVIDPESNDPKVPGTRRFHDLLAAYPRLSATVIQTVGSKKWDAFVLAVVG